MAQYSYDETGAIFSYFLLTLITLTLIPLTVSMIYSAISKKAKTLSIDCPCNKCHEKSAVLSARLESSPIAAATISAATKKNAVKSRKKWLLLIAGWVVYTIVIYHAFTLKQVEDVLWDPYQILNVEKNAEEREVKKAFKKLSLIYHPDKVKEDTDKDAAEKKFVDISKAYKVLTDEAAKKLFDEFGHPDGKQAFELGIALPTWLVEKGNAGFVLFVYTAAFGVFLPYIVARWWRNAKIHSKNKILNETMGVFYRDLKEIIGFNSLLEIIARAHEFQLMRAAFAEPSVAEWQKYEKTVTVLSEKLPGMDYKILKKSSSLNDTGRKALLLIIAHFFRVESSNPQIADIQCQVIEYTGLLLHGLLQIAQSRNWIRPAIQVLLCQGLLPGHPELGQLPFLLEHVSKKPLALHKRKIESIDEFKKLNYSQQLEVLSPLKISTDQLDLIRRVAAQYPRLEIAKAEYTVYGDPVISPSSLVTMSIKFRCVYDDQIPNPALDNEIPDPEEEKENKKWWDEQTNETRIAHTPYFPTIKKPTFCVILANGQIGRLIGMVKVAGTNKDHICRIQFQAPPEVGKWTFQVYIKNDTFYCTTDTMIDLELSVTSADELPEENFDETISEPEDYIVGYEKPVKVSTKKPREERDEYDDSTDSSDNEEGGETQGGQDDDYDVDPDFVE